ncbi:MAG: DMT family transporter [Hyphomicrobiaceae bacterium]|nr:DMT family transporter [Hyphomicrobiaceae bacterium]
MPSLLVRLGQRFYASPFLLLVLAMLSWAGNTIAGRIAVDEISPLTLVSLRWVWVIGALWPIYGAEVKAHWPTVRPRLLSIALMATFGFTVFNVLYYYAAHTTTAVNLGILQGSMPMFVMVGAFVMIGARPSAVQWAGALITALGVVVVATQGRPLALVDLTITRGDWLVLLACLFYALYAVGLRDRPAIPGTVFFTLLAAIAALTSLPLIVVDWLLGELRMPTPTGWLVAIYVAVFPSCLAQLFFMRGVDLIGPSRSSVFLNLVPVLSALLAVGMLGEPFRWYHAFAMLLVGVGIWIAERGKTAG